MIYHVLPACLVVNTRLAVGHFAAWEIREYLMRGIGTDLRPQGGGQGGCDVPATAESAMLNIKTFNAKVSGAAYAFPSDGMPLRPVENFQAKHRPFNNMIALP